MNDHFRYLPFLAAFAFSPTFHIPYVGNGVMHRGHKKATAKKRPSKLKLKKLRKISESSRRRNRAA